MPKDRSTYKYRRLTLPQHWPGHNSGSESLTFDPAFSALTKPPLDQATSATIFQALAKAERPLYLQVQLQEHPAETGNAALHLNNLGVKQLQDGDFAAAFRSLLDAIDQDDAPALPYNNIGLMYLEIGDLERAIQHFNTAILIREDLDLAYGNRGLALLELGNYPASYQDLTTAWSLNPRHPMHHNNLGLLCLELNHPRQALQYFDQAIRLAEVMHLEDPIYYNNRGIAHDLIGEPAQANTDFLKAAQLASHRLEIETSLP